MSFEKRLPARPPSRPANGALVLVLLLLAGGLLVPVIPAPSARAETVWTSTSFDDFNGTGGYLSNCVLNGTGNDTRIMLKTAPDWVQRNPGRSPTARAFGGMAAIDTDDKTVIFGGTDFTSELGDTWVYDLSDNKWTDMAPAESPPARQYTQIATVYGDDKAVLFGGWYYDQDWNPVMLNDTWVYDLGDNAWVNVTPAVSPPARAGYGMATVFGTDIVVLFSGMGDLYRNDMLQDTWTYDISDNLWTQRHPSSSPSGRYGHAMAALWNDDKIVLFGGYNDSIGTLGDTWVFDLSDDRWYQKSPAARPSARYFTSLATRYDDDKVFLFGGFTDDTNVYDLGDDSWTLLTPAHKPAMRMAPYMATVARTENTVVFGGEYADIYQDTWVWDPNAHARSGEYRSPQKFVGGPAYFLTINWTASLPNQTAVKFQVRTADTDFNLTWRNFTGPDGSSTSYYVGESALWAPTPGDSWVQYRAFLSTGNAGATPALEEVNIGYDMFPGRTILLEPYDGAWVNTTSPVFSWAFNDSDSTVQGMFDWQINRVDNFSTPDLRSGEVGSEETAYTYDKPLPEGPWYWRVRTADAHGWGPFSESRSMGVDISPPSAFSPFSDPAKWTSGPVDLIFLTDDNVSGVQNYTVQIDNKQYGAHESPWTLPELPDGIRNIVVRATDRAGNWAEGRTKAFIDRTPPAGFTPEAMPASWTRTMPQITFSTRDNTSGVDHYEVRIDREPFMVRSSPYTPPELEDGEHEITIRAVDRAENFVESFVKIYIDRSKPDPLGVGVEPPGWTGRDQTVTFWTQDPTSDIERYEIGIDGGPFKAAESPFVLTGLKDGTHVITVRAYDLGGNFVEKQVQAFTDRSPPDPFAVSAEPAGWSRQMPLISFVTFDNVTAALTYKAGVDNGTFSKVKSPWTPPELSDGEHLVAVRAYDEAGNYMEGRITIFIDTKPPDKVVISINNGASSTQSRTVRLSISAEESGSGPKEMCFSGDGVSYTMWEPFATERNWTLPMGGGGKAVYIKVKDAVGNEARPASAAINYAEPAAPDSRLPVAIGAAAAILAASIAGYTIFRMRKHRAPSPAGKDPKPAAGARDPKTVLGPRPPAP